MSIYFLSHFSCLFALNLDFYNFILLIERKIFFNIFYDFKKDIINVGIKNEEKEIEILAEKETFLTEAVSWKTDPLLDF